MRKAKTKMGAAMASGLQNVAITQRNGQQSKPDLEQQLGSAQSIGLLAAGLLRKIPAGAVVMAIDDGTMGGVIAALSQAGREVYEIPLGVNRVIAPCGAQYKIKEIWPAHPCTADVLLTCCTHYNNRGGIYIGSSRTANFISKLRHMGVISRNSVLLALADPSKFDNRCGLKSKFIGCASAVIVADGSELMGQRPAANVVVPVGLFKILLAGFPKPRMPEISTQLERCYGPTKKIINETMEAV